MKVTIYEELTKIVRTFAEGYFRLLVVHRTCGDRQDDYR
jgi:hypothetical protein